MPLYISYVIYTPRYSNINFQIESLQIGYNSETPTTSITTIIGITI